MKKVITVIIDSCIDIGYRPLDSVIELLQRLKETHSAKYSNLRLDYEYVSYSKKEKLVLKGDREETPEEVTKRINSEQKNKEYRRQQYEELRKEFG